MLTILDVIREPVLIPPMLIVLTLAWGALKETSPRFVSQFDSEDTR